MYLKGALICLLAVSIGIDAAKKAKLLKKLAKPNELGYKLEDAVKKNLKDDVSSNNDAISALMAKFDVLQADNNALKADVNKLESTNNIDIALNAANIAKNAADIICLKKNTCPTSESGYIIVNNKCIYLESSRMNHANAKLNCLAKMECYGFGRLFEPKSKSMNDLVATEANNFFGNAWVYIGFNDIATDKTYVFDSDNSPVLSAFSPEWVNTYGPGAGRDSMDCGLLAAYNSGNVDIGDWGETECESGSYRRSICE